MHMKSVHRLATSSLRRWAVVASVSIAGLNVVAGAQLKEAKVTQVIKEVQLLPSQAAPRPAAINDTIRNGTAVRTGLESRSELTFPDLTIARLGANTIFSFNEGTRDLDLKNGAILLRVPKGAGGAKINTAAVTAAITGTTVIMEYHTGGSIKAVGLEGTFRICLKKQVGECVLVHAGEMIILRADATHMPDPVHVDLKELLKTSLLITGFPPLPSEYLIAEAVQVRETQYPTHVPLGQWFQPAAVRKVTYGYVPAPVPVFWSVTKSSK